MDLNQNNIVTLLQPTTPVESPLSSKSNNSNGSSDFRNILEEATSNVKRADETASAKQDSQNNNSQPDSQNAAKTASSAQARNASQSKNNDGSAQADDSSFDSSLDAANAKTQTTPAAQNPNAVSDSESLLTERLKALGMDDEKIKAFLDLFKTDDKKVSLDQMIMALSQQMNQNQADLLKSILSGAQEDKGLIETLQAQGFLRQAGMDAKTVDDLLQKQLQSKLNETKPQEQESVIPQLADTTDDLLAKLADKKAQASDLKSSDKSGDITPKMSLEMRVEDKLQEISGKNADEDSPDPVELFRFRDPLSKVANPVQFQLSQADDVGVQTALLNTQAINNGADPLQQGTIKFQVESAVQGVSPAVDSAAKAQVAEAIARETALPRNVSEKSLVEQIVQKFSVRNAGDKNEISIRLDPPSLGTVRMNISTSGDMVRTTIIAENQAVRQVIENNLTQLKDSMSGQGLKMESVQVMVGGESGFKGQDQQQSSRNSGGNSNREEQLSRQKANAPVQGVATPRSSRAGGLSLFV